jgi:5'-3' exonuclease
MTSEESPIVDFYPTSFEIDMNGKKMVWQGVALLPFIDSNRLLEAMGPRYPGLTKEEVIRNGLGDNIIFVADEHSLYPFVESLYGKRKNLEVCSVCLRNIQYETDPSPPSSHRPSIPHKAVVSPARSYPIPTACPARRITAL